jgi:signal transduction histidine kinase
MELILVTVTAVAVLSTLGMAVALTRASRTASRARADRDRAVVAEAATTRALRVSVADLRADAMRLLGYAERLVGPGREPSPDLTGVLAMTQQLLAHTDDMQDYAVPGAASRKIDRDVVPLRGLIEDCIASVSATLGPSIRHWRIGPEASGLALVVDPRAVSHILGRVLSNAARHSRHDDWIEISVECWPAGVAVVIEDDGTGFLTSHRQPPPAERESRGLGLGLVLARVLMEAHGGQMTVESVARVGTKVTLRFPSQRVIRMDELDSRDAAAVSAPRAYAEPDPVALSAVRPMRGSGALVGEGTTRAN